MEVNPMHDVMREMAVAELIEDLRRLSPLERDFLNRWRTALDTMSGTPQVARVFDRLKILASLDAKAQRDRDAAILATMERVEFAWPPALAALEDQSPPVDAPDDGAAGCWEHRQAIALRP
jgi:hypothetical protein